MLGNFNLQVVGIPPALKGVPQIEITFNIDTGVSSANFQGSCDVFLLVYVDGIVNVFERRSHGYSTCT